MKQQLTAKAKKEPAEQDTEMMIKTSWRMPKTLLKELKQYGLDNDMNLQQVATKAFNLLLGKE